MTSTIDRTQMPLAPHVVGRRNYRRTFLSIIVVLAAIGILVSIFGNERFGWPVIATYLFHPSIMAGIGQTLLLTLVCMVLGTLIGGVLALMRLSSSPPLQWIASVYTWFFRGVPLLVLLLFWFNLSALFPDLAIGLPGMDPIITLNANEIISPFLAAVLALSLHESAYMAEIIRSGLSAVDHGQREAAQALGMKPSKVDSRIIIPQSMRIIVPPTANQVISMLKSTSLVSVIALSDLLYSSQIIYSSNYQVIPLLVVATIWYLFLVSLLTLLQARVEKTVNRGYASRSRTSKRKPATQMTEEIPVV